MTCFDIYLTSLNLIGEPEDTSATADYQVRAVRLFGYVLAKLYSVHKALGGNDIDISELICDTLDIEFMLDSRLIPAASLELASLLLLDELPEISEALKKRAEEECARVAAEAVSVTPTREVYGS